MSNILELSGINKQQKQRRSSMIADQIKSMILKGDLKPGDRLPTEDQLCRHFDVSRTTLRESIQMLRVSGLLEVTPGRGSFVRLPDLSETLKDLVLLGHYGGVEEAEVMELRILLQVDMVEKLCQQPKDKRQSIGQFTVSPSASAEENAALEMQWHLAMARMADNSMGALILETLLNLSQQSRIEAFKDPDEVMRVMSVQVRFNTIVQEGDKASASRVLAAYLGAKDLQKYAA